MAAWRSTTLPQAAYIHLPFCKRRCFYCDFPIKVVGSNVSGPGAQSYMATYIDQLLREVRVQPKLCEAPLTTVYFGGGTPSLISAQQLQRILETLSAKFGIDSGAEITMEADPGTFDTASLRSYMDLGVTRFSVGVQQFNQELLTSTGRAHSLDEVYAALRMVEDAQPVSWSLDLISGLPGLTPSTWAHSLQEVLRLRPPHVSTYDLQLEDATAFGRWHREGRLKMPPDSVAADMYREASWKLQEGGYVHYEISNFAMEGHESKHNQVYWSGAPYYAFGNGAASFLSGRRKSRPRRLPDYYTWVERLEAGSGELEDPDEQPPTVKHEFHLRTQVGQAQGTGFGEHCNVVEARDDVMECVMLQLRTARGISLPHFAQRFGDKATATLLACARSKQNSGLMSVTFGKSNEDGTKARGGLPQGFDAVAISGDSTHHRSSTQVRQNPVEQSVGDTEQWLSGGELSYGQARCSSPELQHKSNDYISANPDEERHACDAAPHSRDVKPGSGEQGKLFWKGLPAVTDASGQALQEKGHPTSYAALPTAERFEASSSGNGTMINIDAGEGTDAPGKLSCLRSDPSTFGKPAHASAAEDCSRLRKGTSSNGWIAGTSSNVVVVEQLTDAHQSALTQKEATATTLSAAKLLSVSYDTCEVEVDGRLGEPKQSVQMSDGKGASTKTDSVGESMVKQLRTKPLTTYVAAATNEGPDPMVGSASVEEHHTGPASIRLTDPEGFLLSNDVISDIFVAMDDAELEHNAKWS